MSPSPKRQKKHTVLPRQVKEIQVAFLAVLLLELSLFSCPFLRHLRASATLRREVPELKNAV